ncbi:MAG: hypothetical protein U0163_12350 [Gemmatimonadaceae bacterium]
MRHRIHRAVSAATGIFAVLTFVSCDATQVASVTSDRIIPTVSIDIESKVGPEGFDSVSVRAPLQVKVDATDNAALLKIITRVFADTAVIKADTTTFPVAATKYSRTLNLSLAGVRPGQAITVRTQALDGAGNAALSEATATAFDPNVPKIGFNQPAAGVIIGGTYSFDMIVSDTTGVAKVGYRATGIVTRSDSTLFTLPLPKVDTLTYLISVPNNATAGSSFLITPFAENRDGLRTSGTPITVRVASPGADVVPPLVYQTIPPRLETPDSIDVQARDADGIIRIIGFVAKDSAGTILFRSADTLTTPSQLVTRRKRFGAPIALRGRNMFITAYAIDVAGHTGWAVPQGATVPVADDQLAKRDAAVYAFGLTYALPEGSLGADIAVDTARSTLFISNITKNQVEAFTYGTTLAQLAAVAVGAMPWGMIIDNSASLLLVANSGGTNISKVNLTNRLEEGRVKTANEYVFDVTYTKDDASGGYKFKVAPPIDYSDRPQYIAQSASGALYYSTRPTTAATPGTLRRIDNFLDARTEPRQIWQYGAFLKGHYVILNADAVDVIEGQSGIPDQIVICEHTPGQQPSTATCVSSGTVEGAVAALKSAPVNGNLDAVKDMDVASLALPDTNFVAVGGDRRRVAFGEANTGNRAGRVLLVYDPSGTPADAAQYSAPMEVVDLTNNASDRVYGLDINRNSYNIGVHGAETFFADSSLRLQGKYATFNTGAGIAFHPLNTDENQADSTQRVAFVASGDKSIQIVDSYSYRLRGRIPIRANLYGPLRAVLPTAAELGSDPSLVVKLFGLTPEGVIVIDVRIGDIDNVKR